MNNSSLTLTICLLALVAAAFLIDSSDAWAWSRRRGGRGGRFNGTSSGWRNRTMRNTSSVAARCVDDPHPYYRSLSFSRNASHDELKANLSSFCNKTSAENLTMIVKNDFMLVTKDAEVGRLGYKDRLEVWFSDSRAPTRAKTYEAWSKLAPARQAWKAQKKEKKEAGRRRGGRRGGDAEEESRREGSRRERPERRRRPEGQEEEDD